MIAAKKNPEIEYLRAVAIILILVQHLGTLLFWFPEWLKEFYKYTRTYSGVDLFFCVSGFVITSSMLRELDAGPPTTAAQRWKIIKAFWIRRGFRILPSAWLWLAFAMFAAAFLKNVDLFGDPWLVATAVTAAILFVFNDYYIYIVHVLNKAVPDTVGPYWSLSMEEQFYLVFPFLFLFGRRSWLIGGLLVLIAVQFFLDRSEPMENFLWPNRFDPLMWGVLIAFFQRTARYTAFEPFFLRRPIVALTISILLIVLLATMAETLHEVRISSGLVAIVCATFVWLASYQGRYVLPAGRYLGAVLEWIGSRSYTLYLVHMPSYLMARYIWHDEMHTTPIELKNGYAPQLLAAAAVILLTATELSYRLIEQPLRNYGRRLSKSYFDN
jgi:peptidoglycan/LPS O-acetylase OafA/YrhL